jgi:predicted aspartyl protease
VKPNFSSNQWVIDTGATYHMVITTKFYTNMHHVDNISVNLPNGQSVMVTHIGSIQITPTLLLTNVLCVPSFDFNLISVSKLTSSLHCCIFFLSTYCFIHDLMHWRIGMGKQQNEL